MRRRRGGGHLQELPELRNGPRDSRRHRREAPHDEGARARSGGWRRTASNGAASGCDAVCQGREGPVSGSTGSRSRRGGAPGRRPRARARGSASTGPSSPALRHPLACSSTGAQLAQCRGPCVKGCNRRGGAGLCGISRSFNASPWRVPVALFGAFWHVVASTKPRVSMAFRTVDARRRAKQALSGGSPRAGARPRGAERPRDSFRASAEPVEGEAPRRATTRRTLPAQSRGALRRRARRRRLEFSP